MGEITCALNITEQPTFPPVLRRELDHEALVLPFVIRVEIQQHFFVSCVDLRGRVVRAEPVGKEGGLRRAGRGTAKNAGQGNTDVYKNQDGKY